ncbi:MAG: hypothetical protein WCO81_00810 [Cyanobacteriota bacterium ELA615]
MFRKISLTALVIASAVTLAPNANASTATATVSFSGTVDSSCSFGNVSNGTLGAVAIKMGFYNMGYQAVSGGANSPGYASGSVPLNCNTSAAITVSDPTNNGSTGTIASSTSNTTYVKVSNGSTVCYSPTNTAYGTKTCTIDAGTNPTLTVDMRLDFGATNPTAGTYNYSTTLTATYN